LSKACPSSYSVQGKQGFDKLSPNWCSLTRSATLPIHAVLPDLLAALRARSCAVVVAPPGAGKTTAIAPALLSEPWCTGEILLLSPRRIAARAAAERMAELAGEPLGRTFGYVTRMDAKRSAATRVTVLTEGIFVNRIQADPELAGVSAVLFDEVHERSLDSDFGLALALDAQAALRPDLRLVTMSATLDGARYAALLDDAPVITSEGRSHALELRHLGRAAGVRIEDATAQAIRRALRDEDGGVLAFLPGVAEIERTAERLGPLPDDIVVHKLHGQIDPAAQRAAIAPAGPCQRKLVLATSIAETSLTLDGVRVVVDSGLARRPRYDRQAGMTRLVTERASQAAVTQRAGRAARQTSGVAYRLWEDAATAGLPRFDPPEILEADLSPLLLASAIWGASDPRTLRWLDPPPDAAVAEARARLSALGALDGEGRPTGHGRRIAELPLPPRLAHMLIEAERIGLLDLAADLAVLLSERGLGGNDADLELRLQRWRGERGKRAEAARGLARRWAGLAAKLLPFRGGERGGVRPEAEQNSERLICDSPTPAPPLKGRGLGAVLALAYPDRVSRRRSADGADWISAGGRGFRLDPASPLARNEWLAVAEVQGAASGARILSAASVAVDDIEAFFGSRIATVREVRFDPASGGVTARRERRLGAIRLSSGPDPGASADEIEAALLGGVRTGGLETLLWPEAAQALRTRAAFAGIDLSDELLLQRLDDWLPPLLAGKRRLDAIDPASLVQALEALIGWDAKRQLDQLAPPHFMSPAGSTHTIDYGAEAGPTVELRVQALFGLDEHPVVGRNRVLLVLSLTSPAGRPIQTTRDLPGFWRGSWAAVAKEMRGRYPKHPWPDDPANAAPTLRTKAADARHRR
jgi:ATP-dependent helicase HrpB